MAMTNILAILPYIVVYNKVYMQGRLLRCLQILDSGGRRYKWQTH